MVSASDGGVPEGAVGSAKAVADGGLSTASASSNEHEKTFRKPSPAASGHREQTFRKALPAVNAAGDAYGADESITRIGAPVDPYDDDSVTYDGPAIKRPLPIAPPDDTESVTKVKPSLYGANDDDTGGQATAIIMSPIASGDVRRQVNVGRSVASGMHFGAGVAAVRAELLEGTSDSGLRLTQDHLASDEHASEPVPQSHTAPHAYVRAPTAASGAFAPPAYDPHEHGARYDLRVVIVAFVSFAIPFGLFLYLFSLFARD